MAYLRCGFVGDYDEANHSAVVCAGSSAYPLVDRHVAQLVDQFGLSEGLTPQLKGKLVGILHVDHTDTDSEGSEHRTVLNLIDQTVVSYLKLLDGGNPAELVLPLLSPR